MFAGPLPHEKVQDDDARAQVEKRGWKIQENAEKVPFWKRSEDEIIFIKPIEASRQDLAALIGG
jgi:hypothetical protein